MRHDIVQRQNPLNMSLGINDRKPSDLVCLHRLQGDRRVIVSAGRYGRGREPLREPRLDRRTGLSSRGRYRCHGR